MYITVDYMDDRFMIKGLFKKGNQELCLSKMLLGFENPFILHVKIFFEESFHRTEFLDLVVSQKMLQSKIFSSYCFFGNFQRNNLKC